MIVTGILLLPTVVPHAVQDLQDLKTVIGSTSATLNAAPNNSSWGFFNPGSPTGTMVSGDWLRHALVNCRMLRETYVCVCV